MAPSNEDNDIGNVVKVWGVCMLAVSLELAKGICCSEGTKGTIISRENKKSKYGMCNNGIIQME